MIRDLRDWLRGRALLLVGALALCLGQRCTARPLPGHDVVAFARFLGGAANGVAVEATSIAWEPSRGWLGDLLLGRRLLFVGHPRVDGPSDVFRARVRVSRDGQPLAVEAIDNLTRTPDGSETGLRVHGSRAAYAVFSQGKASGVTVLDLAGARPLDLPGNWFNRMLLRLRAQQQTDSLFGLSRTHVHFDPVDRVAIGWEGARLSLVRPSEPTLHYDAERRSIDGQSATVVAQPLGTDYWLHTLADLLREELGAHVVLELAAGWFGVDPAPTQDVDKKRPVAAPEAAPSDASGQSGIVAWPPENLPPMGSGGAGGEGVWRLPSPLEAEPSGADAALFYSTYLRPDPSRPQVRVDLVAMDMRRLELRMEAGYEEPRPSSGLPGRGAIPKDPDLVRRLRATFNGAFKSMHGNYGMVVDGRVLVPPVKGAATVALTDTGVTAVGTWPPAQELANHITSLRQNLDPLIWRGVRNPANRTEWGEHPLVEGVLTQRSALCLAASGQLYYAFGNKLSATTLARALEHAGCRFAMHLDMNAGHCGFFLHHSSDGTLEALHSAPAFAGFDMSPERYVRWSSQDFFYVVLSEGSSRSDGDWLPNPGAQPEPDWLPAIESTRRDVGALDVEIVRLTPSRLRFGIVAGDAEPLIAGRPAPKRTPGTDAPLLFALNLGHTTTATRYGLAFQPEATLPLRRAYATVLVSGSRLRVVPEGVDVTLSAREEAVQLPQVLAHGQPTERAREPGSMRERGALCVAPDGHVLVARARHDSSDVLALALLGLGCSDAVELDRGSQHDVFFERAGTPESPKASHDTTVLIGTAAPLSPRTVEW